MLVSGVACLPPPLCAPLPQLKRDRQGNEVRRPGEWQGAQNTDQESKGPAGIPSDIRDAEGCVIARAISWP